MKKQTTVRKYGWKPDLHDGRDRIYAAPPRLMLGKLPEKVSLRGQMAPVENQGQLGACTTFALLGADQFLAMKQTGKPTAQLSHLMLYYEEREMEGTVAIDAGGMIRDGVKCLNKSGACLESLWPYDIKKLTQKPPAKCYIDALKRQVLTYQRIPDGYLQGMKQCLADGYPFVFGFTVYESFESPAVAKTGIMPMPSILDRPVGGHAICAVGYDDAKGRLEIRNSWGPGWGDKGYFWMPYEYVQRPGLASDFWTLRSEKVVP